MSTARIGLAFATLGFATQICSAAQYPARKKLIEYGWDVPVPSFVRAHIRDMEQRPFDGLIMRLPNMGNVFTVEQWDEAKFAAALDDLRSIRWGKFTDNFVIMWSASTMDWFSDADWKTVLHNVGLVTQAAAAGRCKGVCFDAEPYGANPWAYPLKAHPDKSFAQCEAQVRKRGAQFIRAIGERLPDAVLHTFFLLSLFGDIERQSNPARRAEMLSRQSYALLPAFVNGLLDGVGPQMVITDGNENSYYYTAALDYYRAYHQMRQSALALVAPEDVGRYDTQMQVSQALYVDHVFNLRQGMKLLSAALTPEQRARWFEQDVYYALTTADEYVWCYSERMSWWENRDIPPGLPEAIASARRKIADGQPLGFDVSDELAAAQKRQTAELESNIVRRTARIARRPADVPPPAIDAKLDDPIWQRTPPLATFLPYIVNADGPAPAGTITRAAYDGDSLYLAFQCDEPTPAALQALGSARDDEAMWTGDCVEIFVAVGDAPQPFVHFIANPRNVTWDAYCRNEDEEDLSYNPKWQSAAAIGEKAWFVEMALPWKEIGIAPPKPGLACRVNICRKRGHERSTWSQVMHGFVAPEYFGVWIFDGERTASHGMGTGMGMGMGSAFAVAEAGAHGEMAMDNSLPLDVQMQFMRPGQVEAAARRFPVVYVPFGLIEWHGPHLPLGNDALKAHAILVKTAQRFGGVVYPAIYFHDGFDQGHMVPVLTQLFERLKKMGFRVIIGISGHNVPGQIQMINRALEPVIADHSCAGIGYWEVSLSSGEESNTDHAAKWETSNMQFFYPELVDLSALGHGEMKLDMSAPWGIGGLDPRKYASPQVGRRNVELASEAIGKKAQELLNSLPADQRGFGLPALAVGYWWSL